MKNPTQCVLWENPELIRQDTMKDRFELLDTYEDDSHLRRYLLKCRECGQRYFFEFYEEVDWVGGNDSQYSTYIPVETDDEVEKLKKTDQFQLLQFYPRLQVDFPKDAKEPKVHWMKE